MGGLALTDESCFENEINELKDIVNDFDRYHESQQDLIKGKDEYIAKLCNDRAELKAELKEIKDILAEYGFELKDFREACLLLRQWRTENLCWIDYEKQKAELNELREFVKIISSHTNINRLTLIGENEITISYFSEKWHKKQFDLVKKVVEKYGKR